MDNNYSARKQSEHLEAHTLIQSNHNSVVPMNVRSGKSRVDIIPMIPREGSGKFGAIDVCPVRLISTEQAGGHMYKKGPPSTERSKVINGLPRGPCFSILCINAAKSTVTGKLITSADDTKLPANVDTAQGSK